MHWFIIIHRQKKSGEIYSLGFMFFLNSSAPKAEKDKLLQYTEMLAMIISGYDYTNRELAEGYYDWIPEKIEEMGPEEINKK